MTTFSFLIASLSPKYPNNQNFTDSQTKKNHHLLSKHKYSKNIYTKSGRLQRSPVGCQWKGMRSMPLSCLFCRRRSGFSGWRIRHPCGHNSSSVCGCTWPTFPSSACRWWRERSGFPLRSCIWFSPSLACLSDGIPNVLKRWIVSGLHRWTNKQKEGKKKVCR